MADNNISTMQLLVTSAAVTVSILSFRFAWLIQKRNKKSEAIKNLLSEKETVGFAAIKLLDEKLPKDKKERERNHFCHHECMFFSKALTGPVQHCIM
jgi:hypothetical protein